MKAERPYSAFKIAWEYLRYYIRASNRHKIHSPFVFDLIENVLKKHSTQSNKNIELLRNELRSNHDHINFIDHGKGGLKSDRLVSTIAKRSLKPKKYAQVIAQCVKHYNSRNVLELGTSLGITSAYIAQNEDVRLRTLEGDPSVLELASQNWQTLDINNIDTTLGNFDDTLQALPEADYDLIYIDGNHKKEPTLRYFDQLLEKSNEDTLFIFDDIHYSKSMEDAWSSLVSDERIDITIDLFFLGLVKPRHKTVKQHFEVRL